VIIQFPYNTPLWSFKIQLGKKRNYRGDRPAAPADIAVWLNESEKSIFGKVGDDKLAHT